jgi:hypothetical protein
MKCRSNNALGLEQEGAGISPAPYTCHGALRTGRRPENLPKPFAHRRSIHHTLLHSQCNPPFLSTTWPIMLGQHCKG